MYQSQNCPKDCHFLPLQRSHQICWTIRHDCLVPVIMSSGSAQDSTYIFIECAKHCLGHLIFLLHLWGHSGSGRLLRRLDIWSASTTLSRNTGVKAAWFVDSGVEGVGILRSYRSSRSRWFRGRSSNISLYGRGVHLLLRPLD